ncbi:MAG TPA: bifunctional ornithine acetyltransferase/N-acetylglutamate synthase [Opitutaceae bacterium]
MDFPRHERCVEIEVDLGAGGASATVLGADLTHEYVSENADYRS